MNVQKLNKSKKPALIPFLLLLIISLTALLFFNGCNTGNELNNKTRENQTEPGNKSSQTALLKVLAVESFLADITKNVSEGRLEIDTLIPLGLDPHSFEPSPGDVAKIAESDILIINGAGIEEWLEDIITGANEKIIIVECSKGLKFEGFEGRSPFLVRSQSCKGLCAEYKKRPYRIRLSGKRLI